MTEFHSGDPSWRHIGRPLNGDGVIVPPLREVLETYAAVPNSMGLSWQYTERPLQPASDLFEKYDAATACAEVEKVIAELPVNTSTPDHNAAIEGWAYAWAQTRRIQGAGIDLGQSWGETEDRSHHWLNSRLWDAASAENRADQFPALRAEVAAWAQQTLHHNAIDILDRLDKTDEAQKRMYASDAAAEVAGAYTSRRQVHDLDIDAAITAQTVALLTRRLNEDAGNPQLNEELATLNQQVEQKLQDFDFELAYQRFAKTPPRELTENAIREELSVAWTTIADTARYRRS